MPQPCSLRVRLCHGLLLLGLPFAAAQGADSCRPLQELERPVVGLALGGGGARGYAHIGALQALEELRVPVDLVAGTSMGSIIGGLTATGMSPAEIKGVVEKIDWDDVFDDETDRKDQPARRKRVDAIGLYGPKLGVGRDNKLLPSGFVGGQKILLLMENLTSQRVHVDRFEQLPIPFKAVTTDIVTGEMVLMTRGSLSDAMRASMSVPGAFDPVLSDDRLLVDGGLVRNLPVDVVRAMGADKVIAVDVGTPLRDAPNITNVLNVLEQMTSLAIVQNTREQIEALLPGDVLLRPALGNEVNSASFDRFDVAIPLGYAATMAQAEQLAPLALSEADYRAYRAAVQGCVSGPPRVDFVRLNNRSRFDDAVLKNYISIQPGEQLDIAQLEDDLRRIYGLGFLRVARYEVVEDGPEIGLEITVEQDDRGADFIETGLTLSGDSRGTSINLQAGYLKTDLDGRGSEFRTAVQVGNDLGLLADVYKYLDDGQRWSLNPVISASRRDVIVYDQNGRSLATAEVSDYGIGFFLGWNIGRYANISLGAETFRGDTKVVVGPERLKEPFRGGEWQASLLLDRLDDLFLPRSGSLLRLEYSISDDALGADTEFSQFRSQLFTSKTLGRHNVLAFGRYNTTTDKRAPLYALFTGGGFLNMSGFEPNELVGQHYGMVGLGYRYQVLDSGYLPGYLGGSIEYGRAADRRGDLFDDGILNGSVYFAYDTPLGPLYLGWGWNEERSGLIFLRLGALLGSTNIGRR
ncbi:MAG: patatin-like phospholipase family protein [Xanthomonadales bacterium]|nr:patatin-like phospholipase family protein [Xanthomonadales bacterium]